MLKPPAERLYGRQRGHPLRPRQHLLLAETLPRIRFDAGLVDDPLSGFVPRPREFWIEIGFGGGEHARALAAAHPEAGLVACEVFENGICSMLSALVSQGAEASGALPGNLRLWDGDARALLRTLPDGCVDRLFLMFPDPWPKLRHAKRRFVHPGQLGEVARVMRAGGRWRIASDDPTYQAWVGEVLAGQSLFVVPAPAMVRPEGWPGTRYEAKAVLAGRSAMYWELERVAA